MRLKVIETHAGYGVFPLFPKGTAVNNAEADAEYPTHAEAIWGSGSNPHWLACVIDGHETFIPDTYVDNGVLTRGYSPTEIVVEKGQNLTLLELVFEWAYVKDESGKEGWLPTSKVISV